MKKMVFGISVAIVGLVFSTLIFAYVSSTPYVYNDSNGLLASFLGTNMLIPFIASVMVLTTGLCIIGIEAYKKS